MRQSKYLYIISDTHICDKSVRDTFSLDNRECKFTKFLDSIDKRNAELIILGDFFDFWQCNLGLSILVRKKLLDRLGQMRISYIVGNHDDELLYLKDFLSHPFFLKIVPSFIRIINNKKFKFSHGHEQDIFNNSKQPGWGRLLCILSALYIDKNGSPITEKGKYIQDIMEQVGDKYLSAFDTFITMFKCFIGLRTLRAKHKLSPSKDRNRIAEHLSQIRNNKSKEKYDIAIIGHTHLCGQYEDWYYNSGSWVKDHNNILIISPKGRVKIFDITDSGIKTITKVITPDKPY